MLPAVLGCTIPSESEMEEHKDDFIVTEYWRVLWGLPIIFSLVQVMCLFLVFPYETPVVMKYRGEV